MAQIGVSAEVLCSVANDIRENNNVMQSNLVSIQESVRSLQGSWKGEAANQLTGIAASMDTMFSVSKKWWKVLRLFWTMLPKTIKRLRRQMWTTKAA